MPASQAGRRGFESHRPLLTSLESAFPLHSPWHTPGRNVRPAPRGVCVLGLRDFGHDRSGPGGWHAVRGLHFSHRAEKRAKIAQGIELPAFTFAKAAIMTLTDLQGIANSVVQRAQRHGYVVPREIRAELSHAGLPDGQWKEVVARLARRCTTARAATTTSTMSATPARGTEPAGVHSPHHSPVDPPAQAKAAQVERRGQDRIDVIQPVKVQTEDRREFTLLSRDVSTTGIRLIGTRSLLGQKVRVVLPQEVQPEPWVLVVRIVWTCAIGEDLFENGGTFLEVVPSEPAP